MIHAETKNAVLKALGKGHISKIEAYAQEHKITKENGEPYSHSMISKVLRGERESHDLEEAIIDCADLYLQKKEITEKRSESLVKKVKAVH